MPLKLLELFKGTGSVGKQAKKMGYSVISLDFDPIYTPDIETDILNWDYKKYSTENHYIPDMIWASPPCNTYSPMVYRLRERDSQTAEPFSDRAKLGTKILYKTLEIINYFISKNPKLLFIMENPRGMMRMDAKMKKLARETTLYCLYGDFKRKPTDFWSNFPQGLKLNQETKQCPNKTIPVQDLKTIEERYSMPSKLIKHFLDQFKDQYYKQGGCIGCNGTCKNGGSIELDNFEESGIVSLPEFQSVKINLPTYMYKRLPDIKGKPPPYRYRIVVPITSSRNLSSRKKENSIVINQKPVAKPIVDIADNEDPPLLEEFSPADRRKIQNYYYNLKANETKDIDDIDKDEYAIVPRGRPLPCGNKKAVTPKPTPKGKKINLKTAITDDDFDIDQDFNLGDLYNSGKSSSSKTPTKASSISSHSNPMYKASSVSSAPSLPSKLSSLASLSSKKSSKASSVASSASFPTDKSSVKAPSVKAPPPAPAPAPAPKKKLVIPVKAPSVSSEGSSDLGSEDLDLLFGDMEQFVKRYAPKKGKGIENIISTKNKMPNKWIEYVKQFAKTNGITYRDALRDTQCKAEYSSKSGGGGGQSRARVAPELTREQLIERELELQEDETPNETARRHRRIARQIARNAAIAAEAAAEAAREAARVEYSRNLWLDRDEADDNIAENQFGRFRG